MSYKLTHALLTIKYAEQTVRSEDKVGSTKQASTVSTDQLSQRAETVGSEDKVGSTKQASTVTTDQLRQRAGGLVVVTLLIRDLVHTASKLFSGNCGKKAAGEAAKHIAKCVRDLVGHFKSQPVLSPQAQLANDRLSDFVGQLDTSAETAKRGLSAAVRYLKRGVPPSIVIDELVALGVDEGKLDTFVKVSRMAVCTAKRGSRGCCAIELRGEKECVLAFGEMWKTLMGNLCCFSSRLFKL